MFQIFGETVQYNEQQLQEKQNCVNFPKFVRI